MTMVFKQDEDFDCGLYAVRFAAILSGKLWRGLELCCEAHWGATHAQIVNVLRQLELSPVEYVGELHPPCIVNYLVAEGSEIEGHYGVVITEKKDDIILYDPMDGYVKVMSLTDFNRVWKAFRYPPDKWSVSFSR